MPSTTVAAVWRRPDLSPRLSRIGAVLGLLAFHLPLDGGAAPEPAAARAPDEVERPSPPALARAVASSDGETPAPGSKGEDEVTTMEAYRVSAGRVAASELEGPQQIEEFDSTQIDDSGVFTVDEFLETLPPGEEGDEQLVLIDGQPAYLDPAMLALGMIEAIEVSLDGSMPEHGAYAKGRVINIRLKKDYQGLELSGRSTHSFAGGGEQWNAKLSGGVARGKLRLLYSIEQRQSEPLYATERRFSRHQNRTDRGLSDLRLPWGYPAAVQAVTGPLTGITDAAGEPLATALVPEGATATPGRDSFVPGDPTVAPDALGQRRFDTAAYRQLSSAARRFGGTVNLSYSFGPRLTIALSGSYLDSRSEGIGPPPVSPASDRTTVPAAYNPFGQDVQVGLVHVEFGPTRRASTAERAQAGLKFNGRVGETWKWNGGVGYQRSDSAEVATDLDPAKFSAALAEPDPARRFNPFVDARAGAVNAHLYPELTVDRLRDQRSNDLRADLGANGDIWEGWGGPIRWSLRGNYRDRQWERRTRRGLAGGDDDTRQGRSSYSGSSAVTIPLVGRPNARPGLRRLETEVSGEYQSEGDGGWEREAEAGVVWSPFPSLLLRARHSTETEAPARIQETPPGNLTGETVIDPLRDSAVVSDVQVTVREIVEARPEESKRTSFGATLEPRFARGFRLSTNYGVRRRQNLFRDEFEVQDIVNNEAAFPGRVVRAEPTAEDLASNRPGRILAVETTGGTAGAAESHDLNFNLDYRPPWQQYGRFRLSFNARHILDSVYELRPGVPFVNEGGSRFNPPDWRYRGNLSWSHRGWTASLRADHTGAVAADIVEDDLPSYTEFDLNVGYRWSQPIWGRFGRGLRVVIGFDNLFDRPPPLADTINGYRGGSPRGRTISLSVSLPLTM